ncbi:lysozyme [Sphingomonas xinjiangensis]|uniref:Lysozyme n=1 Tax=Sphingomonas xinjiangensis TaxID=643568 RepID=A0A840YK85_9SPHN|nr:lysozyme [Sphingomonas xinjiangensis]MBB5709360.1 lysozyme [Sphingomonas xinjiangensis]
MTTRQQFADAIAPKLRLLAPGGKLHSEDVGLINQLAELWEKRGGSRHIGKAGLDLIKQFEGLRLKAYQDTGGVWTIGYGHTGPDVKPGMVITEAQADDLLRQDVAEAERDVLRLFHSTTDNQFDALVSFTFNLGADQVGGSTLRRYHNDGDYAAAKGQFARWRYDNGVELAGLVKRRAAEAKLYGSAA